MRMPFSGRLVANHTGITVSDIDRAIRFWRDVMGFEVTEKVRRGGAFFETITGVRGAEIDIAYVKAPGHLIELLEYVKPDKAASQARPCDPGHMHQCFTVDNIDAVVEAARAGGFEPVGPIQTVATGPRKGARAVYVRDPDGIVLEFIEEAKPAQDAQS
jgi:catechol 2,3-dioxygenase-like lactoylglutathione lyase family enzyme